MTDTTINFNDPKHDKIYALFAKSRRKRRTAEKIVFAFALGVLSGLGLGMML